MKKELIFAIIAIILVAGILFVTAGTNNEKAETCEDTVCEFNPQGSCPNEGDCTKDNNCENPTCGVEKTGSCGCQR